VQQEKQKEEEEDYRSVAWEFISKILTLIVTCYNLFIFVWCRRCKAFILTV